MTIALTENQLSGKPRKIGTLRGKDVFGMVTKGGLNLVSDSAGKILGAGPHRAIAKNIAEKNEPSLTWTELNKGDYIDPSHYQLLLPKYEELTRTMRSMQSE